MYKIGSITGVIGAIMLSLNNEYSGFGYVFFIISAIVLTFAFYRDKVHSMFYQQVIFLTINIYGGFQWLP